MYPTNEGETIELFKLARDWHGWTIVHLQRPCPDAVIENAHGAQLLAEFEHLARGFQAHGHDPASCDLIVCWVNNWPDSPLPVWALADTLPTLDPLWARWGQSRIAATCAKIQDELPALLYGLSTAQSNLARVRGLVEEGQALGPVLYDPAVLEVERILDGLGLE